MTARRAIVARWLLILVIGSGVIAMHSLMGAGCARPGPAQPVAGHPSMTHLSTPAGQPPMDMPGHGPRDESSMLGHMCLAVLDLLGLTLLVLPMLLAVLRRAKVHLGPVASWSSVSSRPRAPPPPTSLRLAELCVSRR